MQVSVFGVGYVGLVQAVVLADVGHDVVCIDINEEKIRQLNNGIVSIHEPGLTELVLHNREAGRLRFTSDAAEGIHHGEFQLIAVGTPPTDAGAAEIQQVITVAESIATYMDKPKIIVIKSTVPVGTGDQVKSRMLEVLHRQGIELEFHIVSNPEFLKEGSAVADCAKPDRIVIGTDDAVTAEKMRDLYLPFNRNHDRIINMDIRSAELTKYAANCMLATRISLMNELSNMAETMSADIELVRQGIGADSRIGYQFIYPGCGYGGSCFPKDVKALISTAENFGVEAQILKSVDRVNSRQKEILFEKISSHYDGNLQNRTFALWGLSFKPNTDDMRDAPSRVLMEALWNVGARVQAFDPVAMPECQRLYGPREDLVLCETQEETLHGADALIIITEWQQFKAPNFDIIKSVLSEPVIFDGRNQYSPSVLKNYGFTYYSIGREAVRFAD